MTEATRVSPAGPIPVALALLDQHWPTGPALAELAGPDAATALERDPRYVIGLASLRPLACRRGQPATETGCLLSMSRATD